MARCGSGHLYCRVADRGNIEGALDLFDREVEQPQRLVWLTPGLGAVDRVKRLHTPSPGWDRVILQWRFYYDSNRVCEYFADEEMVSLFIVVIGTYTCEMLVFSLNWGDMFGWRRHWGAMLVFFGILKGVVKNLNCDVPQANNLRKSNSNGSIMNTVGKVKLFMEVMMIIMKGNHVDVPFDPGGSFLGIIKTRGRVFPKRRRMMRI
ncbi:hypothetical protein Tco_1379727 [Tanacetum coccineum]